MLDYVPIAGGVLYGRDKSRALAKPHANKRWLGIMHAFHGGSRSS